ncbi:hypothetical protein AAON49_09335 [Pseudotenacibaculum sp. MALMAid0570]|uniref:hypothetical protein n=1 Tax=Pseudotenacibaculum sp. MALMAid0570 TaxID=3143938 RepID=UPI0032DED0CE
MKINEAKSIIDIVRESSFGELFFTSLIILPIYLGSWVVVLKQIDNNLWGKNSLILLILVLAYVFTLIVMKHYQSKDKKIENASIKIRQYILSRNWTRMSYERVQKNIDSSFNQELIDSILDKYPEDFRVGTIKGGKKAIVVLGEEE